MSSTQPKLNCKQERTLVQLVNIVYTLVNLNGRKVLVGEFRKFKMFPTEQRTILVNKTEWKNSREGFIRALQQHLTCRFIHNNSEFKKQ